VAVADNSSDVCIGKIVKNEEGKKFLLDYID